MPQATEGLRRLMRRYFRNSGVDHYDPYVYLRRRGWKDMAGYLVAPQPLSSVTNKEFWCAVFLRDEWDYDFDPDQLAALGGKRREQHQH